MRTWNENVTGTDHNMVGLRLKVKGKIFRAETFTFRSLKNVTPEMFQEAWNENVPDDIYLEKDPSEALDLLEYKILLTLEQVAPRKTLTSKANYRPWFTSELKKMVEKSEI